MSLILIAIGSNLGSNIFGDSIDVCEKSIDFLNENNITVVRQSSWYLSAPIPASSQPNFINGVVSIKTDYGQEDLLSVLQLIEEKMGRVRIKKNSARIIDLDLICYNDNISATKRLTLPHAKLPERAFVLYPISEISADWTHPISGLTAEEMLRTLSKQQIRRL